MVLCVFVAMQVGSKKTLEKAYEKVTDAFYEVTVVETGGSTYNDNGIGGYLTERVDYAERLLTIGARYLSAGDEAMDAVVTARKELSALLDEKTKEVSRVHDANALLEKGVTELYDTLLNRKLSEADQKNLKAVYQDFRACNDSIGHEDYNTLAAEYNRKRNASILGDFSGVPVAELYQ